MPKGTNMKNKTSNENDPRATATRRTAADCYAARLADVSELLGKIEAAATDNVTPESATWGDAGSLGHARELLVQVAAAVGAIDENEARDAYGVTL